MILNTGDAKMTQTCKIIPKYIVYLNNRLQKSQEGKMSPSKKIKNIKTTAVPNLNFIPGTKQNLQNDLHLT